MIDYPARIQYSLYSLIFFWIFSITAFFLDVWSFSNEINLFARSGALLTLFSIFLEYNLLQKLSLKFPKRKNNEPTFGDVGNAIKHSNPTSYDSKVQLFAHISIILGTLIWGFGDLINLPLVRNFFANLIICN